jgi:hypothetical protein
MNTFKFFSQNIGSSIIIPNVYEQYVLHRLSQCRQDGTIPNGSFYTFQHNGEDKTVIITNVFHRGESFARCNVTVEYSLYSSNLIAETHSFTVPLEEYQRLMERYEHV